MNKKIYISKMIKVKVAYILICALLFSILNKSTIAQEESTKVIKKNSISIEGVYFHGHISLDKDFDIFINYSRTIYNANNYTFKGEIGIGLKDLSDMLSLVPIHINLKNHIGKNKHKAVFGLGWLFSQEMGIHIPLILGYNYDIKNNFSIELNFDYVLWYFYTAHEGYDADQFWFWEHNYDNYWISLGLQYNF